MTVRLKCVATLSGHLNTGWTLCEQQREYSERWGENLLSSSSHVVKTVLSELCLFLQQRCSQCVHSFSDTLYKTISIRKIKILFVGPGITLAHLLLIICALNNTYRIIKFKFTLRVQVIIGPVMRN
jgi:hypothetical protein